jgi:hypothetical protein
MSEERFPAARSGRRRGRPASRIQQVAVAILIAIAAIRRGKEDGMAAAFAPVRTVEKQPLRRRADDGRGGSGDPDAGEQSFR